MGRFGESLGNMSTQAVEEPTGRFGTPVAVKPPQAKRKSVADDLGQFFGGQKKILQSIAKGDIEGIRGGLEESAPASLRTASRLQAPFNPTAQRFIQGAQKGATLGYIDPQEGESLEGKAGEIFGGFLPYMLTGGAAAGIGKMALAKKFPALARIAQRGAQMGAVGTARPAEDMGQRAKQGLTEATIGAVFQGLGEGARKAKGATKAAWASYAKRKLAQLDADIADDAFAAVKAGKVGKVATSDQYAGKIKPIKDRAVKSLDEVFNDRIETIEDAIIKKPIGGKDYAQTLQQGRIDADKLKRVITRYSDDLINKGLVDEMPKPLEKLLTRIDENSIMTHNTFNGKWTKALKFDVAHEMKKDLYKINSMAYGKENFTAFASEGYKNAAREINNQLRHVSDMLTGTKDKAGAVVEGSGAYSKANDSVKAIYDLKESVGAKGFDAWDRVGGSKKFASMYKDPDGRELLKKIDKVLPKGKRFMGAMQDIEKTQAINKLFASGKLPDSPLMGGEATIGAMVGAGAGGTMGSALGPVGAGIGAAGGGLLGGLAGKATATPRGLAMMTRGLEYAPLGGKGIPAQSIPVMLQALRGSERR